MSACILSLVWAFAHASASDASQSAARALDDAARAPFVSVPEGAPAEYAMLDRPTGRLASRPGHRACEAGPLASRSASARIADGPAEVPASRSGGLSGLGRNPVLRC